MRDYGIDNQGFDNGDSISAYTANTEISEHEEESSGKKKKKNRTKIRTNPHVATLEKKAKKKKAQDKKSDVNLQTDNPDQNLGNSTKILNNESEINYIDDETSDDNDENYKSNSEEDIANGKAF